MTKIIRLMAFVTVILVLTCCSPAKQETPAIVRKVKLASPNRESVIPVRSFSGVIQEAAEVNLAFRVAGPLMSLQVKEGDYVRKGELIARIDPRDYEIQAGVYEAQYDQIKGEYNRLTELNSRKSVADNDYEKAVAGEKMLGMKLQNARDQLSDTHLYAPFSGYIQSVKYETGEMVNAGMTVATLIDVKSYRVEVDLPMPVFLQKENFTGFSCSLPMGSGGSYPLRLVGYQMKGSHSQLYRATFLLDPKVNPRLAPGMTVGVTIEFRNGSDLPLTVPLTALFQEQGKAFVWKYDEAQSTVTKQEVKTGRVAGEGMITILSGLSEKDEIVVSGVHALRDGWKVSRMEPVSLTNAGGLM